MRLKNRPDNFKTFIKKYFAVVLCLILTGVCPAVMTACGTKVVITTGFNKDEVFRLGDHGCYLPEVMVYLTDIQNQYESVYGSGIWDTSYEGTTLEDNVKDTVLARIAQIKTMYLMAVERGITLTDEEEELVSRCAGEYYSKLSDENREYLGIDEATLVLMYREYALADKIVGILIENVNPEISDDEARSVIVQHIFIATGVVDGAGNFVSYGSEEKAEKYVLATDIRERASEGEDFEALAAEYSDEDEITLSFGRGVMEEAVETAVFNLGNGEVSAVVTNESGYHIFKCISTLDRVQTDLNKQAMVEERRQNAFAEEYNSFVSGIVKNLNEDLWESVKLSGDVRIEADFFGIYDGFFGIDNKI